MRVFYALLALTVFSTAEVSLEGALKILDEIGKQERENQVPFSVEQIFNLALEQGTDLQQILGGFDITEADIESYVTDSEMNKMGPPSNFGFAGDYNVDMDGDNFITEEEEILGASMMGIRGMSFSDLSSTSNSIMSMIFSLTGGKPGGVPTPPPMPVFTTEGSSAYWGGWRQWSSCSSSCGGGSRKRYRSCKSSSPFDSCKGSHRQISFCATNDCPAQNVWGTWQSWGSCTKTCGFGQQIRRRSCRGSSCIGDTVQVQQCSKTTCNSSSYWLDWSSWSQCSRSCDGGFKARIRRCYGGSSCSGDSRQTTSCNNEKCKPETNLIWQEWGSCAATCGSGMRTRSRPCEFTPSKCLRFNLKESEPCATGIPCGHWAAWNSWGTCTVTCGLGVKTRIRMCVGGIPGKGGCQGNYEDNDSCNSQTCPTWTDWQPWSMCTATCGGGLQRRARYCRNGSTCPGEPSNERTCNTGLCPRWENWTTWSECSATCGGGTKKIERECVDGNPGQRGCFGSTTLTYSCNMDECAYWDTWSQFTDCSRTCGGGQKARQRECVNGVPGEECRGTHENYETCNPQDCPVWSGWDKWTPCSVTCGRGFMSRQRFCSIPGTCDGENENVILCEGDSPCPEWTNWTSYGACSKTCGKGVKSKTRFCNAGNDECGSGATILRNDCNYGECPTMSKWSDWSGCDKNCGGGNRFRTSFCSTEDGSEAFCEFGGQMVSVTLDEQSCNQFPCTTTKKSTTTKATTTKATTTKRTTTTKRSTTRQTTTKRPVTTQRTTRPRTTDSTETTHSVVDDSSETMEIIVNEINSHNLENEKNKEVCMLLNVNGDCLDHLEFSIDDKIVDVGQCNLPAFIVDTEHEFVTGTAEIIADNKVRYVCMDSWRLRGNKNMECKCRGNRCRPRPKQVPRCIPDIKGDEQDQEHSSSFNK